MLQSVQYTSEGKLSCAGCDDAPVILCIRSEIVAQGECPVTLADTDFVYNHISGTLVQTEEFPSCGRTYYRYTITYDDTALVSPNLLECTDILGILCEGCLTTYIQDVAGQEVHIEVIDGVQNLVTQHGCFYPLASSGYEWTFTGDSGVAQTVSAFENVEFLGGDSISTATAPGDQLTIDLDLSTDVGQLLRFGTDGNILLTCADVDACDDITASNGLTRTGDDIEFGGVLEHNTNIDLSTFDLSFTLSATGDFSVQPAGVNTGVLFVENTTGDVGVGTTAPTSPLHVREVTNVAGNEFVDINTYEHVALVPPAGFDFKGINETYILTNPAATQYPAATISTLGFGAAGTEVCGILFNIADGTGTAPAPFTTTTAVTLSKSGTMSNISIGNINAGEAGSFTLTDINLNSVTVQTSPASTTGYTLTLPPDLGAPSQFLQTDGFGVTTWADPAFAFTVAGDAGAPESVANGNTLTITGTGEATTTISNPDTVTIDVPTGANFSIPLAADSGTAETIVQGDTLTITGTGEVTTVSSNPDTITINVDPSEASSTSTSDNDALALDITDAADDVTFNSIAVAITNPSATRPMDVLISVTGHAQIEAGQDGEWTHFIQRDIDGGGYVNLVSLNHGPTNIGPAHTTINEEWVITCYSAHTISASTTSTFTFRQRILCNTTAAFASTVIQGLLTEGHIAVAVR